MFFFFFAWVQKYLEKVFSVENLVKVIAFDSVILDKNFDWLSLKILMFFGTQFSVEMDSEAYFSKKKLTIENHHILDPPMTPINIAHSN